MTLWQFWLDSHNIEYDTQHWLLQLQNADWKITVSAKEDSRLFAENIAWLTKFSQFDEYLAKNGNTEFDEIMKTELNICKSCKRSQCDKFRLVYKKHVNASTYFPFNKSLKFHIR
jgi:hypothetical protein